MKLKTKITRFLGNANLVIKKNEPEIYLGIGIVSSIGAIVAAGYAGYKIVEILKDRDEKIQNASVDVIDEYTDEELDLDVEVIGDKIPDKEKLQKINTETAIEIAKVVWPCIALEALSETFRIKTYSTLNKRYIGVVGAFNGLLGVFAAYRGRVIEENGELMDRHYMYGSDLKKIEVTEIDENNKVIKKEMTIENIDSKKIYKDTTSRIFGEDTNDNWDHNYNFSMMFLKAQQEMLNIKLHEIGHVFLNEVYYALGYEDTPEGAVIGWLDKEGDGYIDFGLYDPVNSNVKRLVDGKENEIILTFNHDGVIFDKI